MKIGTMMFAALCAAMWLGGCSKKADDSGATGAETSSNQSVTPAEVTAYRDEAGHLFCPVMQVEIASEGDAVGHYDYEGVRYYFCCAACPDRFQADPDKYITMLKSPESAAH